MKRILALCLLCFTSVALKAQMTTNIAWRVTVETVSGGATNSVNTNFRYDYGTKKDALKVDGLVLAFNQYKANGGAQDFGGWLKIDVGDRAQAYAAVKQQADNAALVAKLSALLLSNPDLLSASDLTSLNTIAAKAP